MKGRKQKISKDSCQQKSGAEHRTYVGAPTFVWITENNEVTSPPEDGLLGKILDPYNLNKAYLRVVQNKGIHGVDKMQVGMLWDYLKAHGPDLIKSIKSGKYRPNPENCNKDMKKYC